MAKKIEKQVYANKDLHWDLATALSLMENEPARRNLKKNWNHIEEMARKKLEAGGRAFMITIEGKPRGGIVRLSLRKDGSSFLDRLGFSLRTGDVIIYGSGDMVKITPNKRQFWAEVNRAKLLAERRANANELKGK